jgi:HK97 family phage major capsid protein
MGTLDILKSRHETQVTQLRTMIERAATEEREFTEAEAATASELKRTVALTKEQIDGLAELDRSMASTAQVMKNLPEHVPPGDIKVIERDQAGGKQIDGPAELLRDIWPTPGDYLHDVIHSHQGDRDSRERLQRAIQNEITSDVPGLVPEPIVGTVISLIDASRPIVSFLRVYGMPQYGSSFTRPKIVQHTQVGVQTAQKTELPSRKFTVNPIQVNKVTMGGALDIAFQVVDWTQPSALNAITDDLADQYAIQTEAAMAALIAAAATTDNADAIVTPGGNTSADYIAALAQAAAAVYAGSGRLPNVIFASPDAWAALIGMTDTTGRPVVNAGAPANSMGNGQLTTFTSSILGMPLIVSPGLPPGTIIVGASSYAEAYEDRRGALRVVEPKLLGWEIAYYGYFAGIVTEANAFVKVVLVP